MYKVFTVVNGKEIELAPAPANMVVDDLGLNDPGHLLWVLENHKPTLLVIPRRAGSIKIVRTD